MIFKRKKNIKILRIDFMSVNNIKEKNYFYITNCALKNRIVLLKTEFLITQLIIVKLILNYS